LEAGHKVGVEVNTEKSKCIVTSYLQNAGHYHNLLIADKSFENVAKFKFMGTTTASQNCIHEEIKSRLKSGIACYHSLKKLLSPIAL
jgi:hypothetical protein